MALADSLELSFQQVQKYERGVNRVSASMLVRAARRLDCSVSHLVGEAPGEAFDDPALEALRAPGAMELLLAFARMSIGRRRALTALSQTLADDARD